MRRIAFHLVGLLCTLLLCGLPLVSGRSANLPDRLTDREFWRVVSESSEPNGFFHSDNLLSNELRLQHVIPNLVRTVPPAGAYMGVGPEQNFTYITALRPRIAFIVDVRRGNFHLHLMYKALFELSANRADFVSRLFSKSRPEGLTANSTAPEIFSAFAQVETNEALYKATLAAIRGRLVTHRGLPLSADDLRGIETVYHAFYWYGPVIQYRSTQGFGGWNMPTYLDLMTATDANGEARGYLASEERYTFLRELQSKNLLIPIVGNFGGPKAIRAVGAYLKTRGATVSAFYVSNVEQYLGREGTWPSFCANVATLPLDEKSTFIRAVRTGHYSGGGGLSPQLGNIATEVKSCATR
jgi:hypothetical protein